jgi:hypothetical protein
MNPEEETPKRGINIPLEPEDLDETTQLNLNPAQLKLRAQEAARKSVKEKWRQIQEEEKQRHQSVRDQVEAAKAPTEPHINTEEGVPDWEAPTKEHQKDDQET